MNLYIKLSKFATFQNVLKTMGMTLVMKHIMKEINICICKIMVLPCKPLVLLKGGF